MAELKTRPTAQSVHDFLNGVEPQQKRDDSLTLLALFEKITGQDAVMWGDSIVGFGRFHYKSERSKQKGDWLLTGFSPRKQNLTLYVLAGNHSNPSLVKLGKYKTSDGIGGCLYIKKLADVDMTILASIIETSYDYMKAQDKSGAV